MLYDKILNAIKETPEGFGLIVKVSSIVSDYLGAEKANFLVEKHKALDSRVDMGMLVPVQITNNKVRSAWQIIKGPVELSAEQKNNLRFIGYFLLSTLENILLREQVIVDPLTRLYNRAYLDLRLKEEIEKSKRYKTPFSLLMLDIDRFKSFNDTYGHETGDEVLRIVAKVLRNNTRASDIVFRYGGEEFVVYLQNITKDNAMKVAQRLMAHINTTIDTAERLRKNVKISSITRGETKIPITVSIGVSAFAGGLRKLTVENVVKRADESLYRAKQTGRDHTEVVGRDEILRLLIVDDEVGYTNLLSDFFSKRGYTVTTASSGDLALRILDKNDFDIMLLDLKLPGASGLDVLQRISYMKKKMRVLIVSVVNDEAVRKLGYAYGACEFLQKPISIEYLNKHLMARILEMKS